jgi:hypothetical protein
MAAFPRVTFPTPVGRAVVAGLALLIGVIGLAGCSAAESTSSGGGAPAGADAPPVADAGGGDAANAIEPVQERTLIYTGTITVQVESVAPAADEAIAVVVGLGGFVAGDNRTIDENRSQATLVLRVPADQFSSTLDRLARLGTEQSRQVQAQDVTEELVDLDARIATQQASVDRVRELLARAETIAEIVSLESELTRRQAELDSLIQRRATMAGLVDLATITLILQEPSRSAEEEVETGFVPGLRAGWKGLLVSLEVLLTLTGWLLPWAVVFGLPTLAIVLAVRRRRRRRQPVTAPPAPVAGPPSGGAPPAGPPSDGATQ